MLFIFPSSEGPSAVFHLNKSDRAAAPSRDLRRSLHPQPAAGPARPAASDAHGAEGQNRGWS